jgi:protein-tyrosine-phosphatase
MPSVLFVCTANQFRSPLAAALLARQIQQDHLGGDWRVESAGTWTGPGFPATPYVLYAARDFGLDGLENHRTRQVDLELLSRFDLCIVMESGHKEALESEFPALRGRFHLLSTIVEGVPYDIPDPAKPGVDSGEVARELQSLIGRGAGEIIRLAQTLAGQS